MNTPPSPPESTIDVKGALDRIGVAITYLGADDPAGSTQILRGPIASAVGTAFGILRNAGPASGWEVRQAREACESALGAFFESFPGEPHDLTIQVAHILLDNAALALRLHLAPAPTAETEPKR